MVSMRTSSAVDRGFELRSGQTKYYEIGICCFSAKQAALTLSLLLTTIVVLINCLSTLTDAISRQQKQFTDNG